MSGRLREAYLDVAKFLAIYLVVVHHIRDYAGDPSAYAGMVWLENFSLVMPLAVFFSVSGYLARGMMVRCDVRKFGRRAFSCLWPVGSMFVISILLGLLLYGRVETPDSGWIRLLLTFGWFFFCLVLCEGLTLSAFLLSGGCAWKLMGVLSVAFLLLWLAPVGLFHALEMIPFYWFGIFALPHLLASRWSGALGIGLLLLYSAACLVLDDFGTIGLSYHVTTMHLQDFTAGGFVRQLVRMGLGWAAAGGAILTIRTVEIVWPRIGDFAFLGAQTLGVFFVHMLILIAYYAQIGWTGGLAARLLLSLLVVVFSHFIVVTTRKCKWVGGILWNPISILPSSRC